MKKWMAILLTALFISGCIAPDKAEPAKIAETDISSEIPVNNLPLSVEASDNEIFLVHVSADENSDLVTEIGTPIDEIISSYDDAYYVKFNPNLHVDRPTMPTFSWYINGKASDIIEEVVIEFDLLETIPPLHPMYFGYDRGYLVTLHHFQTIYYASIWDEKDPASAVYDTNRDDMISIPEFGIDLQRFSEQDGKHIKISIPYSEFQSTAKDLTLQFYPGTTFSNLSVYLYSDKGLYESIIDEITEPVEAPARDLLHNVIMPVLQEPEGGVINLSDTWDPIPMQNMYYNKKVIDQGLIMNTDGSVSMPVSLFDLDEYADEIKGKYAVIPEGLVAAFQSQSAYSYLDSICKEDVVEWRQHKRNLIEFAFDNLIDETGQFYGIYDVEQGKLVATDRKSAALPILSTMIKPIFEQSILTNDEIDFLVNSIIKYDLKLIGEKIYYAPHGISSDGVMQLYLSDFVISSELFNVFMEYSNDSSRLDDKYGLALLLEGYANSLKLILEAQEQNATRLPSKELKVKFTDGGGSYNLQPSDVFDINDSYFAVNLREFEGYGRFWGDSEVFSELKFIKTDGSCADNLIIEEGAVFTEKQMESIRECEAEYSEVYNAYIIQNTLYESWLSVYNFLQMQPEETVYAPMYNVHTGEMIEASTDTLYDQFRKTEPFVRRFGMPGTTIGYYLLTGIFNNVTYVQESLNLAMNDHMWVLCGLMLGSESFDQSDPDLYADNGFNVWGYDSVFATNFTARYNTKYLYGYFKLSLNRENWKEYTMRNFNAHIQDSENHVSADDYFPVFYDHISKTVIN